jgi:transposase
MHHTFARTDASACTDSLGARRLVAVIDTCISNVLYEGMRPKGSPGELERRRQRALTLLEQGLQPVEVAQRVGVDRRSVRRWKAAALRGGPSALVAKPVSGRPPKLEQRLRPRLEKLLLGGAQAAGYAHDLWTCPRIAQLIGREFGVHYHVAHVGRLLRRLGWTPQRPSRQARERDEEKIQRWTKVDWPRIKKKPVS